MLFPEVPVAVKLVTVKAALPGEVATLDMDNAEPLVAQVTFANTMEGVPMEALVTVNAAVADPAITSVNCALAHLPFATTGDAPGPPATTAAPVKALAPFPKTNPLIVEAPVPPLKTGTGIASTALFTELMKIPLLSNG